jgi:phenylacetate-CoA ligase
MNLLRSQQVTTQLQTFLTTPVQTLLHDHSHRDPPQADINWFREFGTRVPAYQEFLTTQGIDLAQLEQVRHHQGQLYSSLSVGRPLPRSPFGSV